MSDNRYEVVITLKSSCKSSETPESEEKVGEWDYTIDHGGFMVSGKGSTSASSMTAYSAALHGIIEAIRVLATPCQIIVRTSQKAIGQTAAGIKSMGWTPKGRGPWAHSDLWKELVSVGVSGGHKIVFEHVK